MILHKSQLLNSLFIINNNLKHFEFNMNRGVYSAYSPSMKTNQESDFFQTIRRYTQRLHEERDLSLSYLKKINELTEQLYLRDQQIERLNKVNKELCDKLELYTSVLERSKANKTGLRMSMLIDKKNMTESIIQTHHQSYDECSKLFEQFFIADLSRKCDEIVEYKYIFNGKNKNLEEIMTNCLLNLEGSYWDKQQVRGKVSTSHFFSVSISNSLLTIKKNGVQQIINEAILNINPSFYYFINCYFKKQIVAIDKKLYLVPYAYCMISYYPFPEYFYGILETISKCVRPVELNPTIITESLNNLQKLQISFPSEQSCIFFRTNSILNLPRLENINQFVTAYPLQIMHNYTVELIIDILLLLFLEIPIAIVCQNQSTLNKFMFYLTYIIKPFKYPYPIVFNLPTKLNTLFQSPFPTFLGITNYQSVDKFLHQRAVFDLDKRVACSWPLISYLDSVREFFLGFALPNGHSSLSTVIDVLRRGYEYPELQIFWRDFSRTQIYQNFVNNI